MKWMEKMKKFIEDPKGTIEENARLKEWQRKYEIAKEKYSDVLNNMTLWDNYYEGDRRVRNAKNTGYASKEATNIRNIVYELIETEVDNSIPMPKVVPIHEEDKELAVTIEEYIKNEILTLGLKTLNDIQERTTPVQGGSFNLVEWDNTKGLHCTVGDLLVTDLHPREVIPQPGVTDIDKMDYIFIRTPQTKEYVKRRFGKDVKTEAETDKELRSDVATDDIVTVITAYYKNEQNGIGLYRWCGDVELENFEDYQERRVKVCKKCGEIVNGDVCTCGSKKFDYQNGGNETITVFDEITILDEMTGEAATQEVSKEIEIPYYKPNMFPIVLRKNISRNKYLLGFSDVEVIADQQETIKKLGTKINEKILKGGSWVTLPEGTVLETTDEELKVLRVKNAQEKSLIDVITVQADTVQDRMVLELEYEYAKSSLGITDAYQGKYDSSATSGTAKQYSINQAAGRLESKRVMKNQAFAKLYELMFKFSLAYADDPIPISKTGKDGTREFAHFDKRDFIKQDSAGEYYWNDEFLFDIDPTSTLLTNREAMWNQADLKLQSGAFGPLGDLETNYLYWLEQERNGYPNAGEIKTEIMRRLEEQKQAMAAQEGATNEMSSM